MNLNFCKYHPNIHLQHMIGTEANNGFNNVFNVKINFIKRKKIINVVCGGGVPVEA